MDKILNRRIKKEAVNSARTRTEKEAAQLEYSITAKEVKKNIKKDKEKYLMELAERAEKAAQSGHTRVLYQTTKLISGQKNTTMATVKDANGNTIFDKEAQNKRWMEHFEVCSIDPHQTTHQIFFQPGRTYRSAANHLPEKRLQKLLNSYMLTRPQDQMQYHQRH